MREGYDLDEVDDFVDRVIDALEGRGPGLSPQQIEGEEFKVVRMREGYVMDDVDDWLDASAAELRRLRKSGQVAGAAQTGTQQMQAPAAYDYQAPGYPAPPAPAPAAPAGPGYGAQTQGFAAYSGGYQDSMHGTGHGGGPGTAHGIDPVYDSAVHEIDPALRALDQNYSAGPPAAPPQPVPVPQPAAPQYDTSAGYVPGSDDQSSLGGAATPSTGLHHLEIWTTDLDLATKSFGWLFERLGWTLFQVWDNGRSWQAPGGGPYIVVERSPDLTWVAYDRKAPGLNHLALAVPEQWMVDRIVSEAPSYGWRLMFADRHPHAGGPHHYAAYMENDEGFEVEVVAP